LKGVKGTLFKSKHIYTLQHQ